MDIKDAYLRNTFRNQDDVDGCPLIIGVGMVNVNDGYGYVVCFHLRYADGEGKHIPITLTSLQRVTTLEPKAPTREQVESAPAHWVEQKGMTSDSFH